ncbi:geranylgeranyl pyrophosphate synthase [Syncephalis pseudoplumigaleata]|uniref:Geranylgeranyl pyrophosphate synthase n=1 Tax=Syncephalis pseudoplumigaleata TaxID=1712513 RepID=A0A4P9Z3D1_9FUNG|nr:geranylgeranyl pyrophosphate synthase [Syncephalis pseudoplumigaleata]|eukprot:RKP27053.1 geranylgeranyl pyrophosphate synthase [Syncephalis pseudoplumigaleata]
MTQSTISEERRETIDKLLLEPYHYLQEIRSKILAAFNQWLQVPEHELRVISRVTEMLHTASLLIDDIEDNSTLRRGVPVAHKIYGVPTVINTANFVYFIALNELQQLNNEHMTGIFTEELLNLHRGQGMEIHFRDTFTCPTFDEYQEIIMNKTGGLLRLAIRLLQAASPVDIDCVPLANLLGEHFQMRDDYINLKSDKYTDAKGFCEDLTEGKFSYPIIHSIRADSKNTQLLQILRQRTVEVEVKAYALTLMDKTDSFGHTVAAVRRLEQQIRGRIAEMGGNSKLEDIVNALAHVYKDAPGPREERN